jgi:hypothetical protein
MGTNQDQKEHGKTQLVASATGWLYPGFGPGIMGYCPFALCSHQLK